MRLRHIEVFQAVLQAGTLTGAATLLNISQPAATKVLQHAERQLGFPLFTRVRGRLQLTSEAMMLREKIESISDGVRELQRLASNIKASDCATLRVVSTPTLANSVIPKAVSHLRTLRPDSAIELFTQHTREMLNSIILRETDVGFTMQELDHPGLHCDKLYQGELMVIAPMDFWPASEAGKPISIEQLADAPMVGIAVRDSLGRELQARLELLHPRPRISTWVQTYQLARSLVREGHGLALVDPFTAIGDGEDSIMMRRLLEAIPVSLFAVYRIDKQLDPIQRAFIDQVGVIAHVLLSGVSDKRARRRQATAA
ncbi:MAG TPA: LysR family transcriptional regulator [Steroidobacteraceae bacterium]